MPLVVITLEFPVILRNPGIYYSIHKGPPLAHILSDISLSHSFASYLCKIHYNSINLLHLGLASSVLTLVGHSIYMLRPYEPP